MTIREKLAEWLVSKGMFPAQAEQVLDQLAADPISEPMAGRWNDRAEDYPDTMMAVLMVGAQDVALKWIDENCPKAWYRPMFVRAEGAKTESDGDDEDAA